MTFITLRSIHPSITMSSGQTATQRTSCDCCKEISFSLTFITAVRMVRHAIRVVAAALALSPLPSNAFAPLVSTFTVRSKSNHSPLLASLQEPPQKEKLPEIPFVTATLLSDRSQDLMIGEDAGIFNINNEEWGH